MAQETKKLKKKTIVSHHHPSPYRRAIKKGKRKTTGEEELVLSLRNHYFFACAFSEVYSGESLALHACENQPGRAPRLFYFANLELSGEKTNVRPFYFFCLFPVFVNNLMMVLKLSSLLDSTLIALSFV